MHEADIKSALDGVPMDTQAACPGADDPRALRRLVLSLLQRRQLAEAEAVAQAALASRPEPAEWLDILGMVLMLRGRFDEACAHLERARELAPDYADTYANLAILHEQANRLDAALEVIEEGLKRWPGFIALRFMRARCQRRSGECKEAQLTLRELLRGPLTTKLHLDIEFELAWCADAAGETREAFQHFSRANSLTEKLPSCEAARSANYLQMIVSLRQQFDGNWMASWNELPRSASKHDPVFIVGFPRSGTTLLDTMLGAHPEFALLEEQPAVQSMLDFLATYPGGYPDVLAPLTAEQQAAARATYQQAAAAVIGPTGTRRLLDKSPFHTAHVGGIQRIFPGAPILFVTRHPLDVVLSCFMTNFELNSGTVYFTTLASTVKLYCEIMSLWRCYVRRLQPNFRQVRYEDLLVEPERELRSILKFIDLPWSDAVNDHVSQAAARGRIASASYGQVGRPLYHEARGRWRRYAQYLEPYREQLLTYVEAFGYTD